MAFSTEHVRTRTTIRTCDNNIHIILFSKDPPFRSRGNYMAVLSVIFVRYGIMTLSRRVRNENSIARS